MSKNERLPCEVYTIEDSKNAPCVVLSSVGNIDKSFKNTPMVWIELFVGINAQMCK
jgi:hypothetical protein